MGVSVCHGTPLCGLPVEHGLKQRSSELRAWVSCAGCDGSVDAAVTAAVWVGEMCTGRQSSCKAVFVLRPLLGNCKTVQEHVDGLSALHTSVVCQISTGHQAL
jgi:hypothetical protein